ncbi:CMRF35-like molecule 9 isoform X5 [Homo sapiens]|uniref:CMRF35-like molecule 9 isoform X5 n=1 Tax=Homo sapiens TaxID=9606 RepID=UPI000387C934|nr:CMRF35-like molecule 9 isoform X5 [Homo sapiens]XP_054171188.1 CMRF35-like molecule 9 isoform X5 [Homo sapiens]|eukprot:XP_005257133.1 CMRF35-like molecule 9 isoform X5 [Homo sapiens]
MRLLVLLWGCLLLPGYEALEGPEEISGFEGDTVSLQCTYREELRDHRKYWCRKGGILFSRCSGTIYAEEEGQETMKGRVSIRDSRQELSLIVTLWNLTLQDAGEYWCGVEKRGPDESLLISLFVFPGSSRPPMQLDSTSAEDTSPALSSGSSKPRVSIPMVRILAPVLVLLSLLSAAGLIAFCSHLLLWRKEAQQATETQRNEKFCLSRLPLGNGRDPEDAVINLAGPMGSLTIPEPSPSLYTEIQYLSQTAEEKEAPSQAPEGDVISMPPLHTSEEELGFSKFVSA